MKAKKILLFTHLKTINMKAKTFKKCLLLMFIISFFIYIAISFIQWNLNANNWGIEIRGLFIFVNFCFYCFIPAILHETN